LANGGGPTPALKLALFVAVLLTVGCFVGAYFLSQNPTPSQIAQDTADHLLKGGDLGLGSIFGLMAGGSLS
jgi:hypothetical protein